jgi:hypothetical protein
MTRLPHKIAILLCVFIAFECPASKHRKDIPQAPLPAAITGAKSAFLVNGGGNGNELAFDAFYAAFKQWGQYQLVGKPSDAQIIVELDYRIVDEGTRVWSTTDANDNSTEVHSTRITDPQLVLTISDARTKELLWSTTDHRRLARFEKNREKETVNSAERLVEDLKQRYQASLDSAPQAK